MLRKTKKDKEADRQTDRQGEIYIFFFFSTSRAAFFLGLHGPRMTAEHLEASSAKAVEGRTCSSRPKAIHAHEKTGAAGDHGRKKINKRKIGPQVFNRN